MSTESQSNLTTLMVYPVAKLSGDSSGDKMAITGIEQFFPDLAFPQNGITFLYGARNPAYAYIGSLESAEGMVQMLVDVKVNIGRWIRQKVSLDDGDSAVANTRMLNLASARGDIIELANRLGHEVAKDSLPVDDKWPRGATGLPWLTSVLHAHPMFSHLSVIVYKVAHEVIGSFQVATVFDLGAIELASASSNVNPDLRFYLPELPVLT